MFRENQGAGVEKCSDQVLFHVHGKVFLEGGKNSHLMRSVRFQCGPCIRGRCFDPHQ